MHISKLPTRWTLVPLVLAGVAACSPSENAALTGYVEGEWVYLSSPQPGYLQTATAARGTRVDQGQPLFQLDTAPDDQALQEAQARTQAAQARLDNLRQPRRTPEVASLQASLAAAQANLRMFQLRWERQQSLARQGYVSAAAVDDALESRNQAQAQVQAAQQQLATYEASVGRPGEVGGAAGDWQAAQAVAAQRAWQLAHKTVAAPTAGEITEVYYQPGEWVPAGQPLASLLPDANRFLRFFVPQAQVAQLRLGQTVQAHCDGCPDTITARIRFIATQPEYTPPVIYSKGNREKLVFRVEAQPDAMQAAKLHPGLPIDVQLREP